MKASVTITDVARMAGVSIQTVSRVLNEKGEISQETRQRVLQVIEHLGYRPNTLARSLITRRTLTIGLIIPDVTNPFFPEIVHGAEQVALEQGYTIMLCNTNESAERELAILDILETRRVDGFLFCSSRLTDEQLLARLRRYREVVLINRQVADGDVSSVCVDYATGTRMAVSHLLAGGRRHIGFLAGPVHSHSRQMRLDALKSTLQEHGLRYDPECVLSCAPNSQGGYRATHELLDRQERLDGLLCYNDLVAIGALQACAERNVRVPETLAVVGYDDIPAACLVVPALTTVAVAKSALGACGVALLLKRLAGDQERSEQLLPPHLIVRVSAP